MKQQILQACTIHGNIVKLPDQILERSLYMEVVKALQLIGGKWKGGKVQGFVFEQDPTELLAEIASGEKRNLKKEFQFFGTPPGLAYDLVMDADIKADHLILEPSAGQGAIVKAILKREPDAIVHGYELMNINRIYLNKINDFVLLGEDFLTANPPTAFDRIIANPPFTKNQDIDHIIKMYLVCKKGGRIVTVASNHWRYGQENKCKQFREWIDEIGATVEDIPAGAFKDSGTTVATCKIILDK